MGRHFSDNYQIPRTVNMVRDINDNSYTRISKKDEGNIGGTLSNAHHRSTNEVRVTSSGHSDESSVMELDFQLR